MYSIYFEDNICRPYQIWLICSIINLPKFASAWKIMDANSIHDCQCILHWLLLICFNKVYVYNGPCLNKDFIITSNSKYNYIGLYVLFNMKNIKRNWDWCTVRLHVYNIFVSKLTLLNLRESRSDKTTMLAV